MVTSKIESVAYSNGKRIETSVSECTLSDDIIKLSQFYASLGQRLAKKEQLMPLYDKVAEGDKAGYDKVSLDEEFERLEKEISTCRELIAAQQEYISGYEKENK